MAPFIILSKENHPPFLQDNIAVAIQDISAGTELSFDASGLKIPADISIGCSFAITQLKPGDGIVSHGVQIATASEVIQPGEALIPGKQGNISDKVQIPEEQISATCQKFENPELQKRTFKGYQRLINGKVHSVGTENNLIILNTVKCSQVSCQNLAYFLKQNHLKDYQNVDDIVSITHELGCGMPEGQPRTELAQILVSIMNHPNTGAVVLLGLGCEQISIRDDQDESYLSYFKKNVVNFDKKVTFGHLQQYSNEIDAIKNVSKNQATKALEYANQFERKDSSISYLSLGLKCGGSDRFSGITANPVLGKTSDMLISAGAKSVITETPEFEGYLHVMAARANDPQLKEWLLTLTKRFDEVSKNYPIASSGKQKIAPGNFHGGLLNIYMKAAGAASKSGTQPVQGGLEYNESLHGKDGGLYVLDCPSYDQISTAALALSGCQMVAFTTGLGTSIGSSLCQVLKIGSQKKLGLYDHVDFFADKILAGATIESQAEILFDFILKLASGEVQSKSKQYNKEMLEAGLPYAHEEFMLWKRWGDN